MQVHLLLFMVALFHIVTAATVLVIANLRMRSWWRWKQSDDHEAHLCVVIPSLRKLIMTLLLPRLLKSDLQVPPTCEGPDVAYHVLAPFSVTSIAHSQAITTADSQPHMCRHEARDSAEGCVQCRGLEVSKERDGGASPDGCAGPP